MASTSTFIYGIPKKWFDIRLVIRIVQGAIKRFGFISSIRKLRQYLKNESNFFHSVANRYVRQGKDTFVMPNLPPLNRAGFLDYLLDDVEDSNCLGVTPFAFALVSISARCPYRCNYCYTINDLRQQEIVPVSILIRTIKGLVNCGINNVFLTGGEPMIRWEEIPALLDACRDNKTGFWIVSTGWSMDRKKTKILHSKGLRGVLISLDSIKEGDCVRAKNHPDAFKNAIRAIQDARDSGLMVGVDCVLEKSMLDQSRFEEFVKFVGSLGAHFINCFSPHPVKKGGEYSLEPFTFAEFETLATLMRNIQKDPVFRDMPVVYSPDVWEALRGCVGGRAFLYINPVGDVTPCPFLDNVVGNILKDDICEIIKDIRSRKLYNNCLVNQIAMEKINNISCISLKISYDKFDRKRKFGYYLLGGK